MKWQKRKKQRRLAHNCGFEHYNEYKKHMKLCCLLYRYTGHSMNEIAKQAKYRRLVLHKDNDETINMVFDITRLCYRIHDIYKFSMSFGRTFNNMEWGHNIFTNNIHGEMEEINELVGEFFKKED